MEGIDLELNRTMQSLGSVVGAFETSRLLAEDLANQSPDAFLLIDGDGVILKTNDAASCLIGLSHEELLLAKLQDVFPGGLAGRILAACAEVVERGEAADFLVELPVTAPATKLTYELKVWMPQTSRALHGLGPLFGLRGRDVSEIVQGAALRGKLENDIEQARLLQDALVGKEPSGAEFELATFYRPSSQLGGDWIYCSLDERGILRLLLGDVTGHGFAASLVTGSVHGAMLALEASGLPSKIHGGTRNYADAEAEFQLLVARTLNQTILETGRRSKYMSLAMFSLDLSSGHYCYLSMGHPSPLIVSPEGGKPARISPGGTILGFKEFGDEGAGIPQRGIMSPGEILFLYTDGLVENMGPTERSVSLKQVKSALAAGGQAAELNARIQALMRETWMGAEVEDDTSYLVMRFKGGNSQRSDGGIQ